MEVYQAANCSVGDHTHHSGGHCKACESEKQKKDAQHLLKIHQTLSACAFAAQHMAASHYQQVMQTNTPLKSQVISSKSGSSEKMITPTEGLHKPSKLTHI